MKTMLHYPDPPHLSVGIFAPAFDDAELFVAVSETLEAYGCVLTGYAAYLRPDATFGWPFEVDRVIKRFADNNPTSGMLNLDDYRPVGAELESEQAGKVLLNYSVGSRNGPHPMEVTFSGGPLCLSDEMHTAEDRAEIARLADWANGLLRGLADELDPFYGSILFERTLPSLAALREGSFDSELYASNALLAVPGAAAGLQEMFQGQLGEQWRNGRFFTGWKYLNEGTPISEPYLIGDQISGLFRDLFTQDS